MESDVKTEETRTLILNSNEAKWLRGILQNPLSEDCNPANESEYNRKYRAVFWEALGGDQANLPNKTF